MKSFFAKVSPGLLVDLVGAFIAYLFSVNKEVSQNQKRYIESWAEVTFNGLDTAELKAHKMQVLFNGSTVYGLAQVTVELYNYSDRDFENLKVAVEIRPQDNDSLVLVDTDVFGAHGRKEGITTIKDNSKSALKESLRFEYLLETANRADSLKDPVLKAT